jgi:predicted alpha/beta hydrolase
MPESAAHPQPVAFRNRQGLRLFGVLHTPEGPRRSDVAVILLSPGVKMRVGPQGLYRRMTEMFVALGFSVLRFDFFGLGDSEGTLPEENLKEVYGHIEIGRFVDDTVDAMNWMQEQFGTKRFVVSGLCGGAITGLLAASRDARIAGLLGLGITPLLASRTRRPISAPASWPTFGGAISRSCWIRRRGCACSASAVITG